ncbi:MAG TPA: response regulator [Candidatus Magasanikbacteria bacterium]|nr:response regulator [Candidatus Magasanikbacteria bacterium]
MAKRILIAEDEKPMARALELKLTGAGFEVAVANDGEEAIATEKKFKPDLILLDLMMPKKDGFEVLADLKAEGSKTPVIVSSNLSQEDDFKRAKDLGAVDYFVKSDTPINQVVLNVKKALGL